MSDRPARADALLKRTERRTVASLAICAFASSFAMRFVDPMVGVIARDFARTPHDVALLASAFALPYAFVQPVLGPVGDALGKERIMTICLVVLAVTLGLCALSPNLEILFVLRVLSGAAGGGIIPLVLATIGDRVPMAERQVAISRLLLFSISGQLLGGTLSGLLTGLVGWRGVFAFGASIATVASACAILGFGRARASGRFVVGVALGRYAAILRMKRAQALYLFVFVEGALIFGIQPYLAPMLEESGEGGAVEAGIILACFAAGGILYTLTVRHLLRFLGLGRMLVVAGVLQAGAYLVLAGAPHWQVEGVAYLAIGLGFYMLHNSAQTQVTELTADARGSAVSLHAFSYFVGQAMGAPLVGAALLALGAPLTFAILAAGLMALALAGASFMGRPQPLAR